MSFIEPSMLPDDVLSVYPNGLDPHAGYKVSKDGIILEDFVDGEITVDKLLDNIDLKLEWYQPSADAHEFMTFIRLCLGEEPENSNPITHYFFIDCFFKSPNVKPFFMVRNIDFDLLNQEVVILCSREFSKSTLVTYLILFMASKGYMPGFGKVNFGLYVADSMDNNVKIMMNKIKKIYYMSSYLQNIFEHVHFTDVKIEMVRKPVSDKSVALWNQIVKKEGKDPKYVPDRPKRTFSMMGKGCQTSTRGASDALYRPEFCHAKGTIVSTDIGIHKVEDYYKKSKSKFEKGIEVKVIGLDNVENVTNEHRYWTRNILTDYSHKKKGNIVTKDKEGWCEAKDLTIRHWIGSKIDYSVGEIEPIENNSKKITKRDKEGRILEFKYVEDKKIPEFFNDELWWWCYGLWLGDGHRGDNYRIGWTVANTQEHTVGKKLLSFFDKYGFKYYRTEKVGCYQIMINSTILSQWFKKYKGGNSFKCIPNWIMYIENKYQQEILKGYIAADGYIDHKNMQVRINSVNRDMIKCLQDMCSRSNIPSHIRTCKKEGEITTFPNGITSVCKKQYELRLRENVEVLDISFSNDNRNRKNIVSNVFIEDGKLWRKVKYSKKSEKEMEFIPIQTPSNIYATEFGISHNCFLDDLVPNEKDAYSEAILNSIESTIEADVRGGLSGNGYFMGCIGTPYNKKDPVYKRVENGAMLPIVFPRGNVMPTDEVAEEDWISVWPDRHDYKACKREYDMALRAEQNPSDPDPRKMKALRQEHYLRIRSESDAMISVNSIKWYNIESILRNISMYNIVVTTDFTSSQAKNSDFSGAAVWAVSSNEDYFLLDLTLRRMGIDEQYNNIFKLYDRFGKHKTGSYVYEVGIEIDGNQQTHLYALDKEQLERGKYFEYAKQVGAPKNRVGILSRGVVSENKSKGKIDRLKLMVPKFEKRKIWFPEELKDTSDMKELLEELKYCTNEGKGTKHDDGLDLISQLALIDIQVPTYSPPIGSVSKVDRNGNYQSGSKEVVTAHYNQAIWNRGDSDNYDDYDNGYC